MYKPTASVRPIIFFLNGGGDCPFFYHTPTGMEISPPPAEKGIPSASAEFGGNALWGNDTTQTRIGQLWTHVKTVTGCKTDKFIGIGVSKGATALLNYTRNNPSNVAAFVGLIPAVDVSDI